MAQIAEGFYNAVAIRSTKKDCAQGCNDYQCDHALVEVTAYAHYGESTQKGTPYVTVTFEVTEGEFAGKRVRWDGYLSGGAMQYTIEALQNMGLSIPVHEIVERIEEDGALCQPVRIKVAIETSDSGKEYAKVGWIGAIGGGGGRMKAVDRGSRRARAAQMKSELMRYASAPPAAKSAPAQAPIDDQDDLPF